MTASSSTPNPALERLKQRVKAAELAKLLSDVDMPETDNEWINLLNTMSDDALKHVLNKQMEPETAVAFLEIIDRDLPASFVKHFFHDVDFINAYCAQGYALRDWMLRQCELPQLTMLYVNRNRYSEQEATCLANYYRAACKENDVMRKHYNSQKDFQKMVVRAHNNRMACETVMCFGIIFAIVIMIMVTQMVNRVSSNLDVVVKNLATVDTHVVQTRQMLRNAPLGDYLRGILDALLKHLGL